MITCYENRELPFDCHPAENLTFPLHLHKQLELVYVLKGAIRVQVDDRRRTMRERELAVIFPNCVHSYESAGDSRVLLMIFDAGLAGDFSDLLFQQLPQDPFLAPEQLHPDVLYLLSGFLRDGWQTPEKRLLKGYLAVMVGRLLERLPLRAPDAGRNTDLVHRALYDLSRHFTEPFSLDRIAGRLGFSKYYLSRCFSRYTGCSLNQYVNSLRIGYARQLLESSRLSMAEVAAASGFESPCTFYRLFRSRTGMTPGQYRAQMQKSGAARP